MSIVITPPYATRGASFALESQSVVTTRMDGSDAVAESPVYKWRLNAPLVPMTYEDAQPWMAAIHQLSRPNRFIDLRPPGFELGPYALKYFDGAGWPTGAPSLTSAQDGSTTAVVGNLQPDEPFLRKGDYFALFVGGQAQVKIATNDSTSSGAGFATVDFFPPMRGTATFISLTIVQCRMRLTDAASYLLRPNRIVDITLDAVEVYT